MAAGGGAAANPPGRVVFASWVRAGRTEDAEGADRLAVLWQKRFRRSIGCVMPTGRRERDCPERDCPERDLPEGVTLQFLERVEPKEIK